MNATSIRLLAEPMVDNVVDGRKRTGRAKGFVLFFSKTEKSRTRGINNPFRQVGDISAVINFVGINDMQIIREKFPFTATDLFTKSSITKRARFNFMVFIEIESRKHQGHQKLHKKAKESPTSIPQCVWNSSGAERGKRASSPLLAMLACRRQPR